MTLNTSSVKQAMRLDVALSTLMANELQKWSQIYLNQSPWLGPDVQSLNLGAAIASEVARAVTIEMDVQVAGGPRADFLQAQLAPTLANIRTTTEYGCAKGGLMFKPYIKGDAIAVDFVQADMFYPIAFDVNGKMTACVFADQKTVGDVFYTRLESHTLLSSEYQIVNRAFKSTARDTLGTEIPLASVADWAELEPEAIITGVDRPLFAYFKMPAANSIDPTSPLGVSIYARAAQGDTKCLLQEADEQWSNLLWEMESGQRALYTTPDAFGKDKNNKPVLPKSRLYRLLDLASVQIDKPGFFQDWTPTLREQNILNALDAILRRVEFASGLSYGILSNPESIALTATEIINSKQRYYANVVDIQKALQTALDDLLYAMDVWATLSGAPKGTYSVVYSFDDSIVADDATQWAQDTTAVTMNVMPKWMFLVRNYDLDEATAKQWIADVQTETPPQTFFPGDNLGA
jgi:A118 family predicted phage portal protein